MGTAPKPVDIRTREETEIALREIRDNWAYYPKVVAEHERLLKAMGNVDGEEVLQLVLVAAANVDVLDGISPKTD